MENFIAPNGTKIPLYSGKIITLGLTEEQNTFIQKNLPSSNYNLHNTTTVTDLIALSCTAAIIMPAALSEHDLNILTDYYNDIIDNIDETVFWLGYPKPPSNLRRKFKLYDSYQMCFSSLQQL